MQFIKTSSLPSNYENYIWDLLVLADSEFIPPLSSRNSTRQTSFQTNADSVERKPFSYFETIKNQHFILAVHKEILAGFLSYIPNYSLPFLYKGEELFSNYVSTIIVHPDFRGQGITRQLYEKLLKELVPISTRTWSTNDAHISILNQLEFKQILTIPNDRGSGIDTVYYLRKL